MARRSPSTLASPAWSTRRIRCRPQVHSRGASSLSLPTQGSRPRRTCRMPGPCSTLTTSSRCLPSRHQSTSYSSHSSGAPRKRTRTSRRSLMAQLTIQLPEVAEEFKGQGIKYWPKEELERVILELSQLRDDTSRQLREKALKLQGELDRRFAAEHPRRTRE